MIKIFMLIAFFFSTSYGKDLKDVSLQLPWKFQFQFAGYIIAKEKGFYKDIGLDVNLKEFRNDINPVEELQKEAVQYAILRPTSMIDVSKGRDIMYLFTLLQSTPFILLADKRSGIKDLSDLKNKKVMVSYDLSEDVSLLSMIFSQGMNLNDLNIEKPSFRTGDLLSGKIDAMAAYISNEPFFMKEMGREALIFSPKDYGFDFYSDILSTQKSYIKNNSEEVRKFVEASIKGWEYAFSNISETVNIIYTKYNSQKKSKKALTYEAKELKKLAYYNTNELGKIESHKLENIYGVYKLLGLVKNDIDFEGIVYKNFLADSKLSFEEKQYIRNKQPIKVCINVDFMPFEKFDKELGHIGILAEYYKKLEGKLFTKFEIVKTQNKYEALNFLKTSKCDFISLMDKNINKDDKIKISPTILEVPFVLVTKLNTPFINDIRELKEQKVAMSRDCDLLNIKNKYPNLNLIQVNSVKEGLEYLKNGFVDAFIGAFHTVSYQIQTENFNTLKIAKKINHNLELVLGVDKNNEDLFNILNKVIHQVPSNQMKDIADKWARTIYQTSIDYTLVFNIFLFFIVISIIASFSYFKLKVLNTTLSKQKNFINNILDIQPNMVFIIDKLEIGFANKCFLDFFKCKDLEDFKMKYYTVESTFLKQDKFFYAEKAKDLNWIESILKLNQEDRIVSILEPNTLNPKSFNISIVELEKAQYLFSLTNLSSMISKQLQLEKKVSHDKLTGTFNREYFESSMDSIIERYTKNGIFIFSIIDIDFFKKVNDTYGHDVGDIILKLFVDKIISSSRNSDLLIRWGGEEFLFLLNVRTIDGAYRALHNIRKIIEASNFEKVGKITCSIGATIYKENEDIRKTFKRADNALYKAKNTGRNKVIFEV